MRSVLLALLVSCAYPSGSGNRPDLRAVEGYSTDQCANRSNYMNCDDGPFPDDAFVCCNGEVGCAYGIDDGNPQTPIPASSCEGTETDPATACKAELDEVREAFCGTGLRRVSA